MESRVRATLMLQAAGLLTIEQATGSIMHMVRAITEQHAKRLQSAHDHMTAAADCVQAVILDGTPQPEPETTTNES